MKTVYLFTFQPEVSLRQQLLDFERMLIEEALRATANYSRAARLLGMNRTTLAMKRKQLKMPMQTREARH